MKTRILSAAALMATASAAGVAQTAPNIAPKTVAEIAKAFGARQYVDDISLSPDGTKVAMVQPDAGRGSVLTVADFASGKPPVVILKTSGNPDRLRGCNWANSKRLVCNVFFVDTSSARTLNFRRDRHSGFPKRLMSDS